MDPVAELLAELDQLSADQIAERTAALSDEEVVQFEAALVEAFRDAQRETPTADELAVMVSLREVVASTRTIAQERQAAADERASEAAALIAEIDGEPETAEAEPEAVEGDEPEAPAAEPAAEPEPVADEPVAEPEAVDPPAAPVAEVVVEPEAEAVPIAAAAPAVRRPAVARAAARRPAALAPRREPERAPLVITAGGDIPGMSTGGQFRDLDHVAEGMERRWMQIRNAEGHGEQVTIASIQGEYPTERQLDSQMSLDQIMERVANVSSPSAIAASGGLCAPVAPYYELANISDARRPVRDQALAQFQATRGGISFVAPPRLTDVAPGIGTWTVATDTTPGGATKARVTVTCPGITTVTADAITQRAKFGNFGARTFPEQVRTWMDLLMASHARVAESRLLTSMGTLSTKVTAGQELGAARDVLATLDKAGAGLRSRHRTIDDMPLHLILPLWVQDMIRTDLARQLPGDSGSGLERLAMADEYINTFFAVRDLNVTWTPDGETGQIFDVQPTNVPLNGYPVHAFAYLYPEGSFLFLDGGTLDLGLVRDSTLNGTNDFEMFQETFENVAFVGVEALRIDMKLCADGSSSGTRAITPCGSQSGS